MPFKIIQNILKFILTRSLFVYLVCGAVIFSLVDYKQIIGHARPTTLSRLRPPYGYLADFSRGKALFDKKKMEDYRIYFENVNLVMSERVDADAMLGYCYYYLGRQEKARKTFQRTIELDPEFFWSYYNLGLMAFKAKNYSEASKFLTEGIAKSPEVSLKFMMLNKVYQPLFLEGAINPEGLFQTLKQGYGEAFEILVTMSYLDGHYSEVVRFSQAALSSGMAENKAFFLYYLGRVMFENRSYAEAVRFFEDCLRQDFGHVEALGFMGLSLKQLGQEEAAAVFLAKAQQISSQRPTALPSLESYRVKIF